jgi:hypothetical protein
MRAEHTPVSPNGEAGAEAGERMRSTRLIGIAASAVVAIGMSSGALEVNSGSSYVWRHFGLCRRISQMKPGFEICGRNQLLLHGHASANAYIAKSTIGSCKRSG